VQAVLPQQFELVIEQKGGKKEILMVAVVDLEDHDLFLVIAVDGGVDLIVGSEADVRSVQFHGLGEFFAGAVKFQRHAVQYVPALVLVDQVKKIGVRDKVHVDPAVRIIEVHPLL
jgi:hypothetical protein